MLTAVLTLYMQGCHSLTAYLEVQVVDGHLGNHIDVQLASDMVTAEVEGLV